MDILKKYYTCLKYIVAIVTIVIAGILALKDSAAWGWFLFAGAVIACSENEYDKEKPDDSKK
jgi:hypothetical protein